jgi:hypothetical protein
MGTPTQISVSVDALEYSRYEYDLDTITATVVVQGGAIYTDEEVLVELVKARKSRDAVVATATLTFDGTSDPQEGTATFFLPDIVDQDLVSLVRHGDYFIRATSVSDPLILGESDDFFLSILSVKKFSITGVTIEEVSAGHPLGFSTLNYVYYEDHVANASLDIGAGANGVVTITADNTLAGSDGNAVAVVVVVPSGTSALSASYSSGILSVNLAVVSGVPDNAANTATLIAAAITALTDFTAVASGSGVTPIAAASGPTFLTGGLTSIIRQLSWAGGPLVSIPSAGSYVLRRGETGPGAVCSGNTSEYIVVRVASTALLPTVSTSEEILIAKKKLDDAALRDFIRRSISWVENIVIAGYLEPTNVTTDRDPTAIQYAAGVNAPTPIFTDTDWDFLTTPLTYFMPTSAEWIQIQSIFPQVIRVDSLYGSIANTRVIDIDLEWVEVTQVGGMLQLVPFNQEIAFDFVGLLWMNALRGAATLPNFWHYNMIVGLRDCPPVLVELIGKKAAIDALTVAGLALRPGVGSLSLSRDGVSESVSYTNTAQYGIYTGTIASYKDWIDDQLQQIKGKYRGLTMVVV